MHEEVHEEVREEVRGEVREEVREEVLEDGEEAEAEFVVAEEAVYPVLTGAQNSTAQEYNTGE